MTSEIETGVVEREPEGVVAVTDPVEVPTGRPAGFVFTVTVADPFAGIVTVEGVAVSHAVDVVTVAVVPVPIGPTTGD